MAKEIKLILKGAIIAPEDHPGDAVRATTNKGLTSIKQGESIRFTLGGDFVDATVTFKESPLDQGATQLKYGNDVTVSPNADPKVYAYDCQATTADGHQAHSAGGGEVEVIRGN